MRPNILLLTIGSSNSSITVKQLAALGWNTGEVNTEEFMENNEVFRYNNDVVRRVRKFNPEEAKKILQSLPQPWVIKDPRFCETLRHWKPLLVPYSPALLWITKDIKYVKQSYKRRFNSPADLAERRIRWCQTYFDTWPYGKLKLDVEQIANAVRLFDPNRVFRFNGQTNGELENARYTH